MISQIEEYKSSRQRYIGSFSNPTYLTSSVFNPPDVKVLVTTDSAGGKVLNEDGSLAKQLPPDKGTVVVSLIRQDGSWKIGEVQGSK